MSTSRIRSLLVALALAAPLATLGSACSLLGLDKFTQARCTMDSQCSDLEAISPTGDTCRTWQCNNAEGGDGVCEIRVRDDDGDGSPPMMCAMGMSPDCDDMDPTRSGMGMERCNGVDDDCDGVIDPSFGGMSSPVAMLGASAGRVTFSRGYTGSEVTVVRVPPRGMADPLSLGAITPGASSMLTVTPAMTDDSETGAGTGATLGDDGTLVVYDPVMAAMDCGADATSPVQARWLRSNGAVAASACLEQTTLATATLTPEPDGDVLLVWIDDAGMRECGSAADAPVRARILRTIGGATPRIDSSPVLDLGTSPDALGPGVTFVRGQGWVVAHVDGDGSIVVSRIAVTATLASASATMISSIATSAAAEVSVAAGEGTTVAVAYTEGGCAATNRVAIRTADVSAGSVAFGAEHVASADTMRSRRNPVASYHPAREEWAVFWREVDDETAARLDAAGVRVGAPVELGLGTIAGRPHVEPLTPGTGQPSWGFVAITTGGDVRSGSLACLDPM